MREPVAQVQPEVVVIRVGDERTEVVRPPRSHSAFGENELHPNILELRTKN
jgi:hypothetical protein